MRWISTATQAIVAAALAGALLAGCGLTVTKERPTYQELEAPEKAAVDIILAELTAFNAQVKARTKYNIDEVVDREHISVAFHDVLFTGNLGDNIIHVATWEDLSDAQRALVGTWFKQQPALAEQTYKKLFYRFLAVSQGVKQYMYKVLTPAWIFGNRTLYSLEKDSLRTALSHYAAVGRKAEMWPFTEATCAPVLAQYGAVYSAIFTKAYLSEHFAEIANPENPTGYMYFICRWIADARTEVDDLTVELNWLRDLPN